MHSKLLKKIFLVFESEKRANPVTRKKKEKRKLFYFSQQKLAEKRKACLIGLFKKRSDEKQVYYLERPKVTVFDTFYHDEEKTLERVLIHILRHGWGYICRHIQYMPHMYLT